MTTLEQEILNIINCTIKGKYIGKLRVVIEDDMYNLLLYLNQEQAPLIIGYQGTEEKFKEFVQKEIQTRQMERVSYWTAIQERPTSDGDDWDYDEVII